jgi:hypothetical protein
MMCGDFQPSGLDIHGEPTTTGLRCTLPAYHPEPLVHQTETADGLVRWSNQ